MTAAAPVARATDLLSRALEAVLIEQLGREFAERVAWIHRTAAELREGDEAAREALRPYEDRITWDAPIHSIDDILAQRVLPRTVNLKPSRFGSIEALFAAYDFCEERGMGAYGGGQYGLSVGRGQIQYLAAIFHADAPNDIAPAGYDALDPEPGLPASPLEPEIEATGFRRRT